MYLGTGRRVKVKEKPTRRDYLLDLSCFLAVMSQLLIVAAVIITLPALQFIVTSLRRDKSHES